MLQEDDDLVIKPEQEDDETDDYVCWVLSTFPSPFPLHKWLKCTLQIRGKTSKGIKVKLPELRDDPLLCGGPTTLLKEIASLTGAGAVDRKRLTNAWHVISVKRLGRDLGTLWEVGWRWLLWVQAAQAWAEKDKKNELPKHLRWGMKKKAEEEEEEDDDDDE